MLIAPAFFRSMRRIALAGLIAAAASSPPAYAQQQQGGGGGLHTVNPPTGGAIVYGTLENQKSQGEGMVYMLRQVHGHYADKPVLGKLVQARDGSSLAAFFTVTDNNFTHSPQAGMVLIDTVDGQMMAAVLTDNFKSFPTTEPGMMRTLMNAWHPAGSGGSTMSGQGSGTRQGGTGVPVNQAARPQTASYATQKLYPATAGDRSVTIDLPPGWKITGMSGGQVTAEGPNGERIGANLILQGMNQLRTRDLFTSYVNMTNYTRQHIGKPQMTFHLTSETQLPPAPNTAAPGMIAYFTVDMHEGAGLSKGNAQIAPAAGGGLFVTAAWAPVNLFDAEQPMFIKIINTQRQNSQVISAEGAADMERIRQQGVRNQAQTNAINARSDVQAHTIESQRQSFNNQYNVGGTTRQTTGNSHFDEINAGSEDMQNYILDRGVVQSTSTGNYATFSDTFADDLVKNNPDKLQSTTNRQALGNGTW